MSRKLTEARIRKAEIAAIMDRTMDMNVGSTRQMAEWLGWLAPLEQVGVLRQHYARSGGNDFLRRIWFTKWAQEHFRLVEEVGRHGFLPPPKKGDHA